MILPGHLVVYPNPRFWRRRLEDGREGRLERAREVTGHIFGMLHLIGPGLGIVQAWGFGRDSINFWAEAAHGPSLKQSPNLEEGDAVFDVVSPRRLVCLASIPPRVFPGLTGRPLRL